MDSISMKTYIFSFQEADVNILIIIMNFVTVSVTAFLICEKNSAK